MKKFKQMKKILLTTAVVAYLSGCASVVSKSNYSVAIASNPATADFTIVNKSGQLIQSGVTPTTVDLKSSAGYFKGQSYTISFKKEGYADTEFTLKSSLDGWFYGNILIGGVLGALVIDPLTGAMYKLPKQVDVSLDQTTSQLKINDQINIATINDLSKSDQDKLIRIN